MKTSQLRVALFISLALVLLLSNFAAAQNGYKKPPKEVLDILSAPVTPSASISPARDTILLATGLRYPPLADLAQPMLRLAGLRINPSTNGPHRFQYSVALSLKRVNDGSEVEIALPPAAKISSIQWSGDGKHFAFLNTTNGGAELWVGDTASGKIRQLKGVKVNNAYGDPFQWLPDNHRLLVQLIPSKRPAAPVESSVPREPNAQESFGRVGPVRTFEDLLKTPFDEELFEYYATSQLALVDSANGKVSTVGQPAIFQSDDPAPDGQHILVARVHRPFSYLYPEFAFPKDVEVWDMNGKVAHKLASLPLADQVPIDGVPTGPRNYRWRPTAPATLVWVEALDGGDPKKKVPYRDRLLMLKAPFTGSPEEAIKTEQRFAGAQWGEKGGLLLVSDYDRDRRWLRTMIMNADKPSEPSKLLWSRNIQDRYGDPGTPLARVLPNGERAILQNGDSIYLVGTGASPRATGPSSIGLVCKLRRLSDCSEVMQTLTNPSWRC